jgi:hypothetical protein
VWFHNNLQTEDHFNISSLSVTWKFKRFPRFYLSGIDGIKIEQLSNNDVRHIILHRATTSDNPLHQNIGPLVRTFLTEKPSTYGKENLVLIHAERAG